MVWVNRALAAGFLGALGSQAWVQVVNSGPTLRKATEDKKFIASRPEPATRGAIFSSDLKPIASNETEYRFGLNFAEIPKSHGFFAALSQASGVPASELMQLANSKSKFREWPAPVSAEQAQKIRQVQSDWKADGVSLSSPGFRNYLLGEAAANLVGFCRENQKPDSKELEVNGVAGLELAQNKPLRGKDGQTVGLRDRFGEFLPMRSDSESTPKEDGRDVVLTVDSEIQVAAYAALEPIAKAQKADSGTVVVVDPKTGDVLALATWPSFDPNDLTKFRAKSERYSFKLPAVTDVLEAGSTFKILTWAKALDAGVWGENQLYQCRGSMTVGRTTFGCDRSHNGGVHGTLDPEKAIAVSCNVCAAEWARKVGYEEFLTYIKRLGLLTTPNVGLPSESKGLFRRDPYVPELQLALMGFGQSFNVTPIALANAFAMLGNGGVRMKPRLVKSVGGKEVSIEAAGPMVRPETAARVLKDMEAVFGPEGTADKLAIPGYRLAGKTGTAQKRNPVTGKMKGGGHVSNFVGFVPSEEPKAMILVMVDNPKVQYYGSQVAGPVFREVAKAVIRRFRIPRE